MNLNELSATELLKKKTPAKEIISSCLKRVDEVEEKIHAFRKIERARIKENSAGLLSGIPVAIKDNICVKGEEAFCSSRILEGFHSPYDATVIEKLKKEGAVLFGRANMDEFAFGSSCENSAYGPTRNPWDTACIPGGSSGGSAASVAAGETILALGSDTGGSIRQPAALCGVVGLKPTYGRVSRYGLIAFASSLDQIGPFARTVEDAALLLEVIAGFDERDSTSADIPVPSYRKEIKRALPGIKIGVPKEYFTKGIDKEVAESVKAAVAVLKKQGAKTVEISLPHTEFAMAVYYLIATAEASSNLARFDGVQYGLREKTPVLLEMYRKTRAKGFGEEAKRRILLGTFVLSHGYYDAYYLKAQKVRTLIREDFEKAFKRCDVILTPTSPTPAFKLGERLDDPLSMYLSDIFTISANLAGIPAVSLPCGFTKGDLPVGLQILGKAFDEATVLKVAYNYEKASDWHKKIPEIA